MHCSFCNKEARQVRALVFEKWREAICDECLGVCGDIIADDAVEGPILTLPRPSEIDNFLARLPEASWVQLRHLLATPTPTRKPDLAPTCSFCNDADPARLIAGPRVFICDRCVAQGTSLLQDDSRLIEFQPRQIAASLSKPAILQSVLSDAQRAQVLDGIRQELRRRQDALSSAMQAAAGTAALETAVVDDGSDETMNPETMLSSKARELFDKVAPERIPVEIIGGTSQGRRRLALRVHELSGRPGPFVRIDCAAPGSLARMREAENGTLFLDDVPVLPPAAQELLGISLCDDPALRLSTRIVCTARDVQSLHSRIQRGEFSERLSYDVRWCTVDMGG